MSLSRPALLLEYAMTQPEESPVRILVIRLGQHRSWHDLESLFLCFVLVVASRYPDGFGISATLKE